MSEKPPHTHADLKKTTAEGLLEKTPPVKKPAYSQADVKLADEHIGIVQLISGTTASGEDFYAYVNFRPSTYEEFVRKMTEGERLDVDAYGKVLKKGFGKTPSEDVKKFMEETYGVDHDFMQHMNQEFEKRKGAAT